MELELTLENELLNYGMRRVPEDEAKVLIVSQLGAVAGIRNLDPYYSFYTVEKFEDGTVSIEVLDRQTRQRLWRGTATQQLRKVARGFGMHTIQWEPIEADRSWQPIRLVRSALRQFPREPSG